MQNVPSNIKASPTQSNLSFPTLACYMTAAIVGTEKQNKMKNGKTSKLTSWKPTQSKTPPKIHVETRRFPRSKHSRSGSTGTETQCPSKSSNSSVRGKKCLNNSNTKIVDQMTTITDLLAQLKSKDITSGRNHTKRSKTSEKKWKGVEHIWDKIG